MAEQMAVLLGYVNDMLAVESEMHQALSRQKHDEGVKRFATAYQLIARTEDTIDRHLEELKGCLKRLGDHDNESTLKKAVGTVLGAGAGLYDALRSEDRVSRMIRDDYAALSFAVVSYQMLHTTALAMKDDRTAEVALKLLKDYTPLIMDMSDAMPAVVMQELSVEGKVAADDTVTNEAVSDTREAWNRSEPAS